METATARVFDGGDATIADAGPLDASTRDTGVPAHFSPTTVACIGDSITQGVGASGPTTNWVADLGGLLGKSVAVGNFGVSGTTMLKASNSSYWTTGELPKAEAFAGANDAGTGAAVIIMLGTNDSKDVDGGVDNWNASAPARYRTDYNAMIDALLDVNDAGGAGAASAPKPLVFLALPPPATDTNGYDISGTVIAQQIIPIIVDIAYQRGLPVIDVHTALAGYTADFPDGVHPNDAGHALVAKAMQAGLLSPHVPSTPDGG